MRSSLDVEPMWLSDDRDDWVWGRWYWCRPGARPLGIWSAYGAPIWMTDRDLVQGPPGFQLPGNRYSPSRVSIHLGQEYRGQEDWFLDGLPLDVRERVPAAEGCGGELWDTEIVFSVDPDFQTPLEGVGGLLLGGEGDVATSFCFPLGCRLIGAGGVALGGEGWLTGTDLSGRGGVELGGEGLLLAGGSFAGEGGVELGGEGLLLAGGSFAGEGGVALGGEGAVVEDAPAPTYVAGSHTPWTPLGAITVTLASTVPGDLNLIAAADLAGGAISAPPGWSAYASGFGGSTPYSWAIFSRVYVGGDLGTVALSTNSLAPEMAGLTSAWHQPTVTTFAGTATDDTTNPVTNHGVLLVTDGASLMWWVWVDSAASGFTSVTAGWTLGVDGSADSGNAVYYQDGATAGDPGAVSAYMDDEEDWVTVVTVNEP